MAKDQPIFDRNSFNIRSKNRDPYSYEYLSRPFSIDETSLPEMNIGEKPNNSKLNQSSVYAGLYTVGSILPKQNYNTEFQSPTLEKRQKVEKGFETGEKVVGAIPGVGTAIAAFSSIGRGVGAQTMDENGIYKSKGAAALDSNINPVSGVSGALGIAKDVFDGGGIDWHNIGNYATMNVFGKSASQTALKKEKAEFETRKMYSKVVNNERLGMNNKTSDYKAVPYGKKGMKIRTKLSKY